MSSHSTVSTSSSSDSSTEGTEPTITSGTSIKPVALRRKDACNAFKRLKDCMKEISEFETEYADFEKVVHERNAAIEDLRTSRDELEKKDKKIVLLKSCQELNLENFVAKTGKLEEEKSRMVKEHSSAKKAKEQELDSYLSKIKFLNAEVKRAHDEARLAQAQLEAANQELARWKAPSALLRPLDARDL